MCSGHAHVHVSLVIPSCSREQLESANSQQKSFAIVTWAPTGVENEKHYINRQGQNWLAKKLSVVRNQFLQSINSTRMISCSNMLSRLLMHGTPLLTSSARTTAKQQLKCDKKQLKRDKSLQVHQQENDCIYSVFCRRMHKNLQFPVHVYIHAFTFKHKQQLLRKGAEEAVAQATSRTGKQNLRVLFLAELLILLLLS